MVAVVLVASFQPVSGHDNIKVQQGTAYATSGATRAAGVAVAASKRRAIMPPAPKPAPKPISRRTRFIRKWTPRLDRYLKGSPLAGRGRAFAASAYDTGIDPRLSAAIACVESGKGEHCFRPHNAWGWMGKSFPNWNTAIRAHAKYLHRMYWGGTFSMRMARRYCPPTYRSWYRKVRHEMSHI